MTNNSSVTLENCLFCVVKLTKKADIDKYNYYRYGMGFDLKESFSHPSGGYGKNDIIFRANMSSSTQNNNKARNILVLGIQGIQGIDGATI